MCGGDDLGKFENICRGRMGGQAISKIDVDEAVCV